MFWLGFFVTLIVLGAASLVLHNLMEIKYNPDNILIYLITVIILITLSGIWPVTWSAIVVSVVIYFIYSRVMKFINKRIKKEEQDA